MIAFGFSFLIKKNLLAAISLAVTIYISSIRRFFLGLTEHVSASLSCKALPESNSQPASAASKNKTSSASSLISEKVFWKRSKIVFCFGSGWGNRTEQDLHPHCHVKHSEQNQKTLPLHSAHVCTDHTIHDTYIYVSHTYILKYIYVTWMLTRSPCK